MTHRGAPRAEERPQPCLAAVCRMPELLVLQPAVLLPPWGLGFHLGTRCVNSRGGSPWAARCRRYGRPRPIDMLPPCCKAPSYSAGMQMNSRLRRRGSAVALSHLPSLSHRLPHVGKGGVGRAAGSLWHRGASPGRSAPAQLSSVPLLGARQLHAQKIK